MSTYWTRLRYRKISRRTMLGASAKAGVGAAGLALVGCGDDDDAAAIDTSAVDAAASDAAAAASAAGDAAAAAGRAAEAAESASALAAEAAASEDAEQAAAAAQAAADAAADAAAAAEAAGDAGAAAVAQAAADAAEAAAQAAREAGAADAAAGAAAAQAAADAAAEAAGEASAAAGEAAATAQETAEAAAETAAAAVAAAQEAAAAAGEAASTAAAAIAAAVAEEEFDFSVPWPLDEVDLDASIVAAVPTDNGGLDQGRTASFTNFYSHGAVFGHAMQVDPRDNSLIATVATPEWIDPVTIRAAIAPAPFHDGSTVTAHDLVFTHERAGGIAEYHDGGATSDHPGGWTTCCGVWGSSTWARNEAVDDRTWAIEIQEPDASFLLLHMATVNTSIFSKADTERRGDTAVDRSPMGTGPYRFVSHTEDEDFVFERFEGHFNPVDYPIVVPRYAHNKHLTILVRPEIQSQLAGIETGEIDILAGLGPGFVEPYLDDSDFTVQFQAGVNTLHHIQPNLYAQTMDDGSPNPFLDLRVRQAANHAVNRQALIDAFLLGQGEQGLFAFSGVQGYPSAEQKQEVLFDYDPDKARALLAEAGYPDGFDIPLYWTPEWGGAYISDMVLAVAQDLDAVGIRTDLRSIPVADYFTDAYTRGGPDALPGLFWFFANHIADIGSMWECCTGPGGFFTLAEPQDPSLQELYLAQKVELDVDRRGEMIAELLLEHARQAYFIFIVEPPEGVLTRSDVNWPRSGAWGKLWGGSTHAVQRRKA